MLVVCRRRLSTDVSSNRREQYGNRFSVFSLEDKFLVGLFCLISYDPSSNTLASKCTTRLIRLTIWSLPTSRWDHSELTSPLIILATDQTIRGYLVIDLKPKSNILMLIATNYVSGFTNTNHLERDQILTCPWLGNFRELWQHRRRRWRQEEGLKGNRFSKQNNSSARVLHFFAVTTRLRTWSSLMKNEMPKRLKNQKGFLAKFFLKTLAFYRLISTSLLLKKPIVT